MDTTGKTGPRRVVQAGQGLVEYALILALIAAVAVVGTMFLGKQVSTVLSHTGSALGARSVGGGGGTPVHGEPCGNGGTWDQHGNDWVCEGETPVTPGPPSDYGTKALCEAVTGDPYQWHNTDGGGGFCRSKTPTYYTTSGTCQAAHYTWDSEHSHCQTN
jgi:Flp pilus assembly pilin Flp